MRWFQSVNSLSVTGKADNATQQLLYSAQAKAASGYSPESYDTLSRSNRYKAAVVPLQRRLKALGYLSGSADGYFGSNTYRAVRNFQSRNGLSVTGVADSGMQQLLYSSSARPASGSSSSGSGTSTGYRLLYEAQPKYAVISCGADNEYGHPHDDTLSRLRDADVTVYRTDLNGTIVCRSDGVDLTFTTEKEG